MCVVCVRIVCVVCVRVVYVVCVCECECVCVFVCGNKREALIQGVLCLSVCVFFECVCACV